MYILKVSFRKEADMIYFSQLDIFRLFMRALRRAEFPIVYTAGFNPHPKISFSNAVKLGIEGAFEAKFYFEEKLSLLEFKQRFLEQLPEGLRINGIETVTK